MSVEIISTGKNSALELSIAAWLDAKQGRSRSSKTFKAYSDGLQSFRNTLHQMNMDLDGNPASVATVAQVWAAHSARENQEVEAATYNQRLAILSSFYTFAKKRGLLVLDNPISRVERRPVQAYARVSWLSPKEGKQKLSAINRTDLAGKRDYAMLAVAIQTGRRLSELAGLRWGDLKLGEDGKISIIWKRTKGGKTNRDTLVPGISKALMEWLSSYYKEKLGNLPKSSAVWVSLSPRNKGQPLGIKSIANICEKRMEVSQVHSLRHTFARAMEDSGAKVSEIQARLGHSSLATTGRYLAALNQAENAHAGKIAEMFGLDE